MTWSIVARDSSGAFGVAVVAGLRRAGVGSALCRAVMGWSREQGAQEVMLEVRAGSRAAVALHGRLGFQEIARRPGYYANPVDDAVIMKLVLAKWAADRLQTGGAPDGVAAEAMSYLQRRLNGHGCMILLDQRGRFGIAHNTPRMAWAYKSTESEKSGFKC